MGVVDALLRVGAPRRPDAGRVAQALRTDPAAGLSALVRLLESPRLRAVPPHARLTVLDSLRAHWPAAIDPTLESLRNRPIPLDADELARFHRVALALRALRDAYRADHEPPRDADGVAPPAPDALPALAFALEAQSRLLAAACLLRIALPREDWDAACALAVALQAASALDQPCPDPCAPARPVSAREALVLPMLLRLLEPLGLPAAQLDVAGMLARRLAGSVGVRIDVDGLPHVCARGPALMLSSQHGVRLDTRLALQRLGRVRERLSQGESRASLGLRTPLPSSELDALLAALQAVWRPYHVPTPLGRPPAPFGLMRIGLPATARPARPDAIRPPQSPAVPPPGGPSPYVYGRGTVPAGAHDGPGGGHDRPARAVQVGPGHRDRRGPDGQPLEGNRAEAIHLLMQAIATPVEWLGQDARRAVFARTDALPRLMLGQLAAVLPVRAIERAGLLGAARAVGAGAAPLRLGRVVTLAQTGAADGRETCAHDVGVEFWPGAAVPVRVRFEDSNAFEDAWWMPEAHERAPASLVVRRDRIEPPAFGVVRDGAHDVELQVLRLLERGPDFDRLEVSSA